MVNFNAQQMLCSISNQRNSAKCHSMINFIFAVSFNGYTGISRNREQGYFFIIRANGSHNNHIGTRLTFPFSFVTAQHQNVNVVEHFFLCITQAFMRVRQNKPCYRITAPQTTGKHYQKQQQCQDWMAFFTFFLSFFVKLQIWFRLRFFRFHIPCVIQSAPCLITPDGQFQILRFFADKDSGSICFLRFFFFHFFFF